MLVGSTIFYGSHLCSKAQVLAFVRFAVPRRGFFEQYMGVLACPAFPRDQAYVEVAIDETMTKPVVCLLQRRAPD
jgi:hypothetical protein